MHKINYNSPLHSNEIYILPSGKYIFNGIYHTNANIVIFKMGFKKYIDRQNLFRKRGYAVVAATAGCPVVAMYTGSVYTV
jgi:hypothetical protein